MLTCSLIHEHIYVGAKCICWKLICQSNQLEVNTWDLITPWQFIEGLIIDEIGDDVALLRVWTIKSSPFRESCVRPSLQKHEPLKQVSYTYLSQSYLHPSPRGVTYNKNIVSPLGNIACDAEIITSPPYFNATWRTLCNSIFFLESFHPQGSWFFSTSRK